MHLLVFTDNVPSDHVVSDTHLQQIRQIIPEIAIVINGEPTDNELAAAEILIASKPLKSLPITRMHSLRWVHVTSAGVDKLPPEITQSDIIVTNSSGVHPIPIAEQIFTYMLMFARGFDQTTHNQFEKKWERSITVFELHGKTIGIVGLGRIGKKVAEIAKAFDMKVLAIAKHATPQEHVDEMCTMEQINILLNQSDFVINCLPGTEETRGLFDRKKFKLMKSSAYFISIGRGFSTVEKDLVESLNQKIIAGCGLDVFEKEPLPPDSPLWEMKNVILTPHSAGKTPFYMDRVIDIFCENLKAYREEKTLPNLVNKAVGY